MQPVICAQHDNHRRDATELWHIPRLGGAGPLCGARLSGRVRKSKMAWPNCNHCVNYDKPWALDGLLRECLLQVSTGPPVPGVRIGDKRWRYFVSTLVDQDFLKVFENETLAVTQRGRIVVNDLQDPAPWWDRQRRVLHARWSLEAKTRCGRKLAEVFTTWDLKILADKTRERRDNTITCIACLGARW